MGILSTEQQERLRRESAERRASSSVQQQAQPQAPAPVQAATPTTDQNKPSLAGVFGEQLGETVSRFFPNNPLLESIRKSTATMPGAKQTFSAVAERIKEGGAFSSLEAVKQTAKFGSEVGSLEYLERQAALATTPKDPKEAATRAILGRSRVERSMLIRSSLGAIGLDLPEQQEWDKISFAGKAAAVGVAVPEVLWNMGKAFPKVIVEAPVRYGASVGTVWKDVAKGVKEDGPYSAVTKGVRGATFKSLAEKEKMDLPLIGEVPTYWQMAGDAQKARFSRWESALFAGNAALGDILIFSSAAEAAVSTKTIFSSIMKSRFANRPGSVSVVDSVPDGAIPAGTEAAIADYSRLPAEVASRFKGNPTNIYAKVTPSGLDGTLEVSIVRTRESFLDKATDKLLRRTGQFEKGNLGVEQKLQSFTVTPAKRAGLTGSKTAMSVERTTASEPFPTTRQVEPPKTPLSVIPRPLKGYENAPMTSAQFDHLGEIAKANGIDVNLADAVVKAVTGKQVIGELTQAEYVSASKVLAAMNKNDLLTKLDTYINPGSLYLSPARRWMGKYEENSGIPIYRDGYIPVTNAIQAKKIFVDQYKAKAREIYGSYAEPRQTEFRRLLRAHSEGDASSVTKNPSLSPEQIQGLVEIDAKMRGVYDELFPMSGLSSDRYLKNYQSHLKMTNGVYQLYKEGEKIPKSKEFFAEFERTGNFSVQLDDSLALFDIYVESLANKIFMNPMLENVGALVPKLPDNVKPSFKNFALESMGYAGKLEKALDEMVPAISRRIGVDLPPDLSRQFTQSIMDLSYAGALGLRPAAVVRQTFQMPMFTYARLGPRFLPEAIAKSLSSAGREEFRQSGLSVPLGTMYGVELAKDATMGATMASNAIRDLSQKSLWAFGEMDTLNRRQAYFQFKFQWDDAVGDLQSGKIGLEGFERTIDLSAFRKSDQTILRDFVASGDFESAFKHAVRDVIDETQFPVRKGASAQATYGLGGKLGFQFGQFTLEATHTMGSWIRRNQWDKVIRFGAASYALQRTFEEAFDVDVSKWVGQKVFYPTLAPIIQFGIEANNAMMAVRDENRKQMNSNWKAITDRIQVFLIPGGLQMKRYENFKRSIDAGIDAEGKFGVFSQDGSSLLYTADFTDLFWDVFMGFPRTNIEGQKELIKDQRKDSEKYQDRKKKIMQLYVEGKIEEAARWVEEWKILIDANDFDRWNIPYSQRLFDSLPRSIKPNFIPRMRELYEN